MMGWFDPLPITLSFASESFFFHYFCHLNRNWVSVYSMYRNLIEHQSRRERFCALPCNYFLIETAVGKCRIKQDSLGILLQFSPFLVVSNPYLPSFHVLPFIYLFFIFSGFCVIGYFLAGYGSCMFIRIYLNLNCPKLETIILFIYRFRVTLVEEKTVF